MVDACTGAGAWVRLGECQRRAGRIEEARDSVKRALKIAPRDADALRLQKQLKQ